MAHRNCAVPIHTNPLEFLKDHQNFLIYPQTYHDYQEKEEITLIRTVYCRGTLLDKVGLLLIELQITKS